MERKSALMDIVKEGECRKINTYDVVEHDVNFVK